MLNAGFIGFLRTMNRLDEVAARRVEEWIQSNHEPIGKIAVEHGLICGRQIDEILNMQRETRTLFGEIAIALHILTQVQVDRLLDIQRLRSLNSGIEALSLSGLIPLDESLHLLAQFTISAKGDPLTGMRATAA